LSGSDKEREPSWPAVERRQSDRRSGDDRRISAGEPPAAERRIRDRRSGTDRRDETAWTAVPIDTTIGTASDAAEELIAAATAARETAGGDIVTGCNIENATYGLTLCAERVALVKALSEGHHVFTRIAVVADTGVLTPPCGPCRQLLWEYCGDIDVILANLAGSTAHHRLASLLPLPFDSRLLEPRVE
jgi:cytidine deaminase